MTDTPLPSDGSPSSAVLKGWHVLIIFLCFFGVMFAVNGVFLYHAITSFPGEDVKKSYVQGLNYNDTLEARKAQRELGWTALAGYERGELIFQLEDAAGVSIYEHDVEAEVRRAATMNEDQVIMLARSASGDFRSVMNLEPGQWSIRFKVRSTEDGRLLFEARKNITVVP